MEGVRLQVWRQEALRLLKFETRNLGVLQGGVQLMLNATGITKEEGIFSFNNLTHAKVSKEIVGE